jgi:pyruvate kinase
MIRRTKIIATLGPATDPPEVFRRMLMAGVNLVRINLSHGTHQEHAARITQVRTAAQALQKTLGILIDLQGPKIRISRFLQGEIQLCPHAFFILDAAWPEHAGTSERVGIDYKALPQDVKSGDILLLNDGFITLEVIRVIHTEIHCVVQTGGILSNNKGINRQGGGLTAEALTSKDRTDIIFAATQNADYVALSFPRCAEDIHTTRRLLHEAGSQAGIIAKIERTEAITALDEIIEASDAVMVARGDLGVELGYAELPAVQKQIIARARSLNRAVITATQMMESMIHSPIPTRAEVSDVANAVLDGTDAVMLSAETATGEHPDTVISAMHHICLAAEKQRIAYVSHHRLECQFVRTDEAIAMAAMYTANHMDVKGIIALTESGSTPLWMSRIRSGLPIYGLTRSEQAQGRMTLYRGVYPMAFDVTVYPETEIPFHAIHLLKSVGLIQTGDRLIITKGDIMGRCGGTNMLQILGV